MPWPGGVEQDFLEVPSMMLENFVWQPEILRRLSKHVSNGSCFPESTIEALSKSRFLMTGYAKSKYLAMSLYDLTVHSGPGPYEFEGKQYDAVSLYNTMIEKYTGIAPMPDSFAAASWFHLLMGYDAVSATKACVCHSITVSTLMSHLISTRRVTSDIFTLKRGQLIFSASLASSHWLINLL